MKYKSYKSLTDLVVKAGANAGGSRRESLYAGLNQSAANLNSYSFLQTLNFSIMAGEHAFDESSKDIIFIEDQETIDQLLSLKFSAKHATVGYIPFKTFMVSLPVKAMSGETKLEPCLVSLDEPEEYKAAMSSFMAKELGMPKDFINQVFDNSPQLAQSLEPQIRLIIPLPAKNGGIAHLFTGIPYTKIPLILNTPVEKFNNELYIDLIGRSTADSYELEEEEVQLQLKMLRLTIAMFIYNKVTDNKHFRTGVPKGGIAPKYLGLSKSLGKSCKKYVFNKHDEHKGERGKVGVHVRSEHIRQYVDPKFYKGEHANTPIGERFTIVKETLVGEGKPYTQESEKH